MIIVERRPGLAGMGETEPAIWTSGAIASLCAQVDTEIQAIGRDVTAAWAAGKLSSAARAPWKAFYDEWIAYKATVGFFAKLTGATVSRLKSFQERAIAWREKFEAIPGKPVATTSPKPKPGTGAFEPFAKFFEQALPAVKWTALVVGALLVSSYAAPLIKPLLASRARANPRQRRNPRRKKPRVPGGDPWDGWTPVFRTVNKRRTLVGFEPPPAPAWPRQPLTQGQIRRMLASGPIEANTFHRALGRRIPVPRGQRNPRGWGGHQGTCPIGYTGDPTLPCRCKAPSTSGRRPERYRPTARAGGRFPLPRLTIAEKDGLWTYLFEGAGWAEDHIPRDSLSAAQLKHVRAFNQGWGPFADGAREPDGLWTVRNNGRAAA